MANRWLFFALLAIIVGSAYGQAGEGVEPGTDGIWRAHGYGLILEVHYGKAKLYEVTRVSCVPASEEESSDYDLEKYRDVQLSSAGDRLTLFHRNGNVYRYSREAALPAECSYYNHEGLCLEGVGVPPDIEVPLTLADLEAGGI